MKLLYPSDCPIVSALSRSPIALLLTLGLAMSGCQTNTQNPSQQTASTLSPSASDAEVLVVRGLTMGDRACYMQVETAQGQLSDEMASFELCEQEELVGQRVRLTRVPTPVMAMSCQGDPECTEQETVNLITLAEAVTPTSSNASTAVVSQLYDRFPAPSADASASTGEVLLLEQDRAVLAQFFDSELTDLILADQDCAMQRGGICRLDFDPIWNSQDPTAYEAEVSPTDQPEVVKVRVQDPNGATDGELEYRLVQEGGKWRIADISYPEGFTLHELLDTFPPE